MVKKCLAAVGAALLIHGVAQAANTDAGATSAAGGTSDPAAATWAAQGQLGLIFARGNTSTESGNANFAAAHAMGRWTVSGGLAALYASTGSGRDRITTQEDLNAHLQADLQLSKRTFWFTSGMYDRNLFSGFAYQESVATGGGFNFVQTPATQLSVELGIGDRRQQPEVLLTNALGVVYLRTPQPVVNDAVLVGAATYAHAITATTKISNSLLVQSGSSDTLTSDNLQLQVKIDASLSLAIGMQLVNNTNPPPGNVRHTDTVMTVNLVYELKNPKLSATGTPQLLSKMNYDLP
jgi:putative salt-induced outer membrane protein